MRFLGGSDVIAAILSRFPLADENRVVKSAKKMAPRLRGGPAVEWLPLQAFATGGGGAYPRRNL